jgi:uncharacterized protein YprB with RNaseH-like and TPR domain
VSELLVYLDIETTSLKASDGMVVAIGVLKGEKPEVRFAGTLQEEKAALEWLCKELEGCTALVTWNGAEFDIPFLFTRSILHNIDVGRLLEIPMLDLYQWCRGHMLLSSYKQEAVGRFLGVDTSQPFHGGDVLTLFKLVEQGDVEARRLIVEHCREDIILLKRIHERLKQQVERSGWGLSRKGLEK